MPITPIGTRAAAEALGIGHLTGALRPGLAADLLVVDGDVTADPTALERPRLVFARGEPHQTTPEAAAAGRPEEVEPDD